MTKRQLNMASVLTNRIKVIITKESIVSKKLARDHMIAKKLEPHTIPISNQLIWSVSCARQISFACSRESKGE